MSTSWQPAAAALESTSNCEATEPLETCRHWLRGGTVAITDTCGWYSGETLDFRQSQRRMTQVVQTKFQKVVVPGQRLRFLQHIGGIGPGYGHTNLGNRSERRRAR